VATSVRSIANAVAKEWERRGKNVAFEFNGKSRAGDPQHLQADVGSLTSLGFKWQIPVSQGISEYVSWFIADSQRPE
jgi:UDP-glucose 4-epimerase